MIQTHAHCQCQSYFKKVIKGTECLFSAADFKTRFSYAHWCLLWYVHFFFFYFFFLGGGGGSLVRFNLVLCGCVVVVFIALI